MPLSLSKIISNTATVAVQEGEDVLNVVYYPSKITEKTFADLQAFSSMDQNNVAASFAAMNDILCALMKSWDLYQDDEQTVMYPITPDDLANLPIVIRTQVLNAIFSDISPNKIAPQTQNS